MPTLRIGLSLIAAALVAGCLGDAPTGPSGRLAIAVAPVNLSGVTDAEYTLTVTNAAGGAGEVVWTRALSSQQYGDGGGSASYVGSCDAATGVNTVKLELTALYDATGLVPVGTYMNPTPILREATCVQNTDVAVQFDITLARQADQGFFDVAVQFRDIFCSAKLDCQKPDGTDLDLLHNAAGARDMTVVMGFACTGSLTGTTFLYLDDLVIDCTGQALDVRVSPVGLGNITPSANPGGYLFGAAVYRGVEGFASKAYWNVSLGLNAATFASSGACTLKTRATASAEPFPQEPGGFPLPAGSVYPVIDWQIQLSSATGRTCTTHEVNGGNGVATNYLGYLPLVNGFTWATAPITLQHRFQPVHPSDPNGQVLSAGAPICNPGCDRGVCTAQGAGTACDCTGTGYGGDSCATPVCTAPCTNGGTCAAPDTCACGPGFYGATCASACAPVANCATTPTCTDGSASSCASCAGGFLPDGAGGCVQCLGVGDCADDGNACTATACEAGACVHPALTAGTSCGDATVSTCTAADTCDGAGGCVANHAPAGTSCGDAGSACVIQDTCDGAGACADQGFVAVGAACGDPGDTECSDPDSCDGAGACLANHAMTGASCGDAGSACVVQDTCDGSGGCFDNGVAATGTSCGDASDTECTDPDSCDGAGACLVNHAALGAACGDAGSACVIQDTCDGDGACADQGFAASGTSCGSPSDTVCDNPDSCDATGTCLPRFEPSTTVCRADAGACDVAEACDGAGACPADAREPNGTACTNGVFCDGVETCTDGACLDGSDPCNPSTEVCDEATDQCLGTTFASCLDARDSGATTSGPYVVDPDGAGPIAAHTVYCDMVTDGGGWTLMAKFSQHQGINTLPLATYQAYFGATGGALWIEGNAMAAPSTPVPSYDGFHVESLDWRQHLVFGQRYALRQHFFKGAGTEAFDVKYAFSYNGHVKQDGVAPTGQRVWSLESRQVLTDATNIGWVTDPTTYFWLPFSSVGVDGSNLYTACNGYALEAGGCNASSTASRRHGNAGILDTVGAALDPAGAWAPHMNTSITYDVVYVHQAASTYGTTGAQMALLYWIREGSCLAHGDCDSGLCQANGTCLQRQPSCLALRNAGQATSGVYTLDRDGVGGDAVPVQAYCDMTTDGGGWMYVAEPGRSRTNPADTYVSGVGDYHRYIYDLNGFSYDQVLVVRPAGYSWCNSWGSDSTYWGPNATASMGIAYDTTTWNYHNGQFTPYAWIQQPYSTSTSCSSCWTTNNTTPSMVTIATLDGATGAVVKLDPPGGALSQLEISNYDAFISQAGGCNLTGGNLATWRTFVRAAPAGDYAQLHGPAQTFAANAWTPATFTSAPIAAGVQVSGANLTFARTGVYRVTLSYRPGSASDVWTAVRLYGGGATRGLSAGHGNLGTYSPDIATVSLLASVPDAAIPYQIQVGRLASATPVETPVAIVGVSAPAVQATVERLDDLAAPARSYAQLQGAAQAFAANTWTAATWSAVPLSHGVTVSGSNLTFTEAGVYRVTLSYRQGGGGDVWTAAALFGGGVSKGVSAGYGNAPGSPELFTTSFLAQVTDVGVTHQIRLGRLSDSTSVISPVAIVGEALPAVQATVVRETGTATSYAQLHGGAQTFPPNAWTAVSFNAVPIALGLSASGTNVTFTEPGVYRVTLSYRQGAGTDVWTAVRLFGSGATVGLSAGYGNIADSPELFTTSFLASVPAAGAYQVQIGRLNSTVTVAATAAIAGVALPPVQATLVKLP